MLCSFIHLANGDNPFAVRAELPCVSAASGDVAFLVKQKHPIYLIQLVIHLYYRITHKPLHHKGCSLIQLMIQY